MKDTMTSVDIVEIVKCGVNFLEVFGRFFCHNLGYSPSTDFVVEMFEKRDLFRSQEKSFASKLSRKDRIVSLRWCFWKRYTRRNLLC